MFNQPIKAKNPYELMRQYMIRNFRTAGILVTVILVIVVLYVLGEVLMRSP